MIFLALLKTLFWFLAQNQVIENDFMERPQINTFSSDSDTKEKVAGIQILSKKTFNLVCCKRKVSFLILKIQTVSDTKEKINSFFASLKNSFYHLW